MSGRLPPPGVVYWIMHALPRLLWPLFGGLTVEGREHIPSEGSFLLLSNHQSLLDPFLIGTHVPRVCHPMAKSTQFSSRISRALLRRCYAFPVRRFQVDPQAVRFALRRLREGSPVHVYIEGERTWDGKLQPPRPGTIRLALKAGVPILPCVIDGAYAVWPRWDRRFQRGDIRVVFGPTFRLPQIDDRSERNAAVPAASARIMAEIAALLGVAPPVGAACDDP